jgi:hypothetical protein
MKMKGGNGIEAVHFFKCLLPGNIFQGVLQVYKGPVAPEVDIAEMFGDLLRYGH